MSASDLAMVIITGCSIVAVVAVLFALQRILVAVRRVTRTLDELNAQALPLIDEMAEALAEANEELARVDRLVGSAESISATVDATSKLDGWASTPAERMVTLCRTTGCRLGLVTNGLLLAYPERVDALLRRRLRYVYLSLHGGSARVHNLMVRTQAYDASIAALQNLSGRGLDLHVNCVVTRHNLVRALVDGADWRVVTPAVFAGQGSMGNGAAMRVAPVGAYWADDRDHGVKNFGCHEMISWNGQEPRRKRPGAQVAAM